MLKKTYTWIGCLMAMALAGPAHAGGVIIDGWDGGSPCANSCEVRLGGSEDDDAAQELYLLVALVFNGHAAAQASVDLDDEDLDDEELGDATADEAEIVIDDPNAPLPTTILDEVEGQELGGCAAAPGGLAALAGLLMLRRRRR